MMVLLQSRGKMKCKDLARELEVSERQIQKYKTYLDEAGIFITSKYGAYGGYEIDKSNSLSNVSISFEELIVLESISEKLKYSNDIYQKKFSDIVEKIKLVSKTDEEIIPMNYFTIQSKCNYNHEFQRKKYADITLSYITNKKLKIKYYSINSGHTIRTVHPYGLFNYKGDTYMVAFCEKRDKFIDFKVCRISDYTILEEKYKIDKAFSWREYSKNSIGIYKDDEIDIILKVKYPFSIIISEKVWVENQKIIECEDNSIIFKAKIRGYTEIKSWVLSMGSNVEVIKPDKLKSDIIMEIEKMKNIY